MKDYCTERFTYLHENRMKKDIAAIMDCLSHEVLLTLYGEKYCKYFKGFVGTLLIGEKQNLNCMNLTTEKIPDEEEYKDLDTKDVDWALKYDEYILEKYNEGSYNVKAYNLEEFKQNKIYKEIMDFFEDKIYTFVYNRSWRGTYGNKLMFYIKIKTNCEEMKVMSKHYHRGIYYGTDMPVADKENVDSELEKIEINEESSIKKDEKLCIDKSETVVPEPPKKKAYLPKDDIKLDTTQTFQDMLKEVTLENSFAKLLCNDPNYEEIENLLDKAFYNNDEMLSRLHGFLAVFTKLLLETLKKSIEDENNNH